MIASRIGRHHLAQEPDQQQVIVDRRTDRVALVRPEMEEIGLEVARHARQGGAGVIRRAHAE